MQMIISAYIGERYNRIAYDIVTWDDDSDLDPDQEFFDVRRKLVAFRLVRWFPNRKQHCPKLNTHGKLRKNTPQCTLHVHSIYYIRFHLAHSR